MIKYTKKQTIKNIITDDKMEKGELCYDWQEFIMNRQEAIQSKINSGSWRKIEVLLGDIKDVRLVDNINDAIIDRECKVSYIQYNKGFLDGMKLALTLGKS